MQFELDAKQTEKFNKWRSEQEEMAGKNFYGAIGGVYSFTFTPTNIGVIIKAQNAITKEIIDLSNYDSF